MAIVFDKPRSQFKVCFRGTYPQTAHLISTLPGDAGHEELDNFAYRIELNPKWIQDAGTCHEHYDLFGGKIEKAREAGAVEISPKELVSYIQAKRDTL